MSLNRLTAEQQQAVIGHYQGDCHDARVCEACAADRRWMEALTREQAVVRQQRADLDQQTRHHGTKGSALVRALAKSQRERDEAREQRDAVAESLQQAQAEVTALEQQVTAAVQRVMAHMVLDSLQQAEAKRQQADLAHVRAAATDWPSAARWIANPYDPDSDVQFHV